MHVCSMANLIRKSQILKLFLSTKVEHDDVSRESVEESKENNPAYAFECVQIEKLPSSSTKSIYSLLLHLYQSSPTD
jgi:hypothetical protein